MKGILAAMLIGLAVATGGAPAGAMPADSGLGAAPGPAHSPAAPDAKAGSAKVILADHRRSVRRFERRAERRHRHLHRDRHSRYRTQRNVIRGHKRLREWSYRDDLRSYGGHYDRDYRRHGHAYRDYYESDEDRKRRKRKKRNRDTALIIGGVVGATVLYDIFSRP